jgi:hypothetical protein
MSVSRDVYLGVCVYRPKPYTRVQALGRAEIGGWRKYDFKQALPREGRAFARNLPGFDLGHHLAFGVVPNERNEADKDQFLVADPVRVAEVLDFRARDPELARRALVEEGVPSLLPGADSLVIALPAGLCTLVRMVKHPTANLFVADNEGLDHLPTFVFDDRLFLGHEIEGRNIAVPGVTVGVRVGELNWARDSDFMSSLLKRLRRAVDGSPVTRAQIPTVVGYLARARLLPSGSEDLGPTVARFRRFVGDLVANKAAVDEMVEVISALRPVEAAMEKRRAEVREELRRELEPRVRADLESALGDLATKLRTLESDIADAKARAVAADAARRALEAGLREELAVLSVELESAAEGSRARVVELARRLGEHLTKAGWPVEFAPSCTPPWSRTGAGSAGDAKPWSKATAMLDAAAERGGFVAGELRLADVAARAGLTLLLPQEGAFDFVRCYASAVGGGPPIREPLHPAVISLDDLWRLPVSGHPTGFARAWTAARLDPRRYRVVLLEGLQRTPTDLWVPSLAEVLAGSERPANLLVFASLAPGFVDPDRVWAGLSETFVAFVPTPQASVNAELLIRMGHREQPTSWFDASAAPKPDKTEIIAQLDSLAGEAVASRAARSLALFAAARAVELSDAASRIVASFGEGEGKSPPLTRGATWLRDLLAFGKQ